VLEDLETSVELNFSCCKTDDLLVTEGGIIVVEGFYKGGVLYVEVFISSTF
jgi:hypothetical protein